MNFDSIKKGMVLEYDNRHGKHMILVISDVEWDNIVKKRYYNIINVYFSEETIHTAKRPFRQRMYRHLIYGKLSRVTDNKVIEKIKKTAFLNAL